MQNNVGVEEKNMKNNAKKLSALLLVFTMLMLCSCGSSGKKIKTGPDELFISLDDMLEVADDSWTMTELLNRLYPDYVIYTDSDGFFQYRKKLSSMAPPQYDMDKMTTDSSGFKVYDAGNPQQQSWKGIDVSSYQGEIDWKQVAKSGVDFAFIRLGYRGYSEGAFVKDDRFDENVKAAIKNNIGVGVYFVTQAISAEEAEEEAKWVLDAIKPYKITWPVVYDIEGNASPDARANGNTPEQNTENIIAFCDAIKDAGLVPMIYSNTRWFVSEMDLSKLSDYDIWYAFYNNSPYFPYNYQIWQYSDNGSVKGISSPVDLDISFVNYGK